MGTSDRRWVSLILALPDSVLRTFVRMAGVGPQAEPSTIADLCRGKPTEIDELDGKLASLGREYHVAAPANDAVVERVRRLEAATELSWVAPAELRAAIEARSI